MSENNNLREATEINILLLGETGVGKSTFINSILNYLQFENLQDAINEPQLFYALPTSFPITDENFQQILVKIGEDEDEKFETGKSSTKYPKAHVFNFENGNKIRIIDTPGIGDTRGIEEDQKNLENILSYLSNYTHINAICILFKPNNTRFALSFRYVVKELLTQLHKDAISNIVYCFTNTYSTFYKPGATRPLLQALLDEVEQQRGIKVPLNKTNVFCFDNESFRYLVAQKQNVFFCEKEVAEFGWVKSVESLKNMFQHVSKLTVHDISQTLSLNHARQMILALSKPMAEITKNIEVNILACKERVEDLRNETLTIDELKAKLCVPQIDLIKVDLGYPRTVCTAVKCIKIGTDDSGQKKVNYITICHNPCHLKGVATDTRNNAALLHCSAMQKGKCKSCNCLSEEHMHITYEMKEVRKLVNNPYIELKIRTKEERIEETKKFIAKNKEKINDLENEKLVLVKVCAQFSRFVAQNAISVVNDDIKCYLEHLIREEEQKLDTDDNNGEILNRLIKAKEYYKQQQEILSANIANGTEDEVEVSNIKSLIQSLYDLKGIGKTLRNIFDNKNSSKQNSFEQVEKIHYISTSDNKSSIFNSIFS